MVNHGEQIAPGMYLLDPVEIDPELEAEFLAGLPLGVRILLGLEENDEAAKKRRAKRIRLALAKEGL